jgi:hypothetical protein
MKKWSGLLSVFILIASSAVYAQTFVDINVNGGNRDMKSRVRRLEAAVSQLQQRVYELEENNQSNSSLYICKLKTAVWGNIYFGKKKISKFEAEESARKSCRESESFSSSSCEGTAIVKCENSL